MNTKLIGMGIGTGRVVVDEGRIVEVTRIKSITACKIPWCTSFFAVSHRLTNSQKILFPYRKTIRTLHSLSNLIGVSFPEDRCPDTQNRMLALHNKGGMSSSGKQFLVVGICMA